MATTQDTRATLTVVKDVYCQGCGGKATRLFEGDHCAVCHLEQLVFDEQGALVNLDAIRDLVHHTVVHGYAHPDDVREAVEEELRAAEADLGKRRERFSALHDRRLAHAEFLSDVMPVL